jgi:hypothetical protein
LARARGASSGLLGASKRSRLAVIAIALPDAVGSIGLDGQEVIP